MKTCKDKAIQYVRGAAAGGALLAPVPIPGLGTGGLIVLETSLIYWIGRIYGDELSKAEIATVASTIGVASLGVKVAVMEAMNFLPGLGWVVKASVAGTIVNQVGKAVVAYFENKYPKREYVEDSAVEKKLGLASAPSECAGCKKQFKWYWRWRQWCSACQQAFCKDCAGEYVHAWTPDAGDQVEVCARCLTAFKERTAPVTVVKEDHLGAARTLRTIGHVETRVGRASLDKAIEDVKLLAVQAGGNAVVGLKIFNRWNNTLKVAAHTVSGTALLVEHRRGSNDHA